jgi:hypothetical protein
MQMYQISSKEEVNISTCNLSTTIHNIWLQQSRKRGACLYVATPNDYICSFRQLTLYYSFLHGGRLRTNLYRDEL